MVDAFQQLGYIRLPIDPSELLDAHGIQTIPYQIAFNPSVSLDDLMTLCSCPSGISFTISANGNDSRYIACNLKKTQEEFVLPNCMKWDTPCEAISETASLPKSKRISGRNTLSRPKYSSKNSVSRPSREISQRFGTSLECASNILNQHANWLRHRHDDEALDASILELYARGLLLERRDEKQADPAQILQ